MLLRLDSPSKTREALLIKASSAEADRGELRGGNYIRRIVTGFDKDGSPQYRYLRTQDDDKDKDDDDKKDKKEVKKSLFLDLTKGIR